MTRKTEQDCSLPKDFPPSVDLSKNIFPKAAHAMAMVPSGVVVVVAPSVVLSPSIQSPEESETTTGSPNDNPLFEEAANLILERCSLFLLPYLSNSVQER